MQGSGGGPFLESSTGLAGARPSIPDRAAAGRGSVPTHICRVSGGAGVPAAGVQAAAVPPRLGGHCTATPLPRCFTPKSKGPFGSVFCSFPRAKTAPPKFRGPFWPVFCSFFKAKLGPCTYCSAFKALESKTRPPYLLQGFIKPWKAKPASRTCCSVFKNPWKAKTAPRI